MRSPHIRSGENERIGAVLNILRIAHIYYSMDKYSGCNIVESVVAAAPVPHKEKKKRNVKGFFVRLAVAAVCVGVIAAVRFTMYSATTFSVAAVWAACLYLNL